MSNLISKDSVATIYCFKLMLICRTISSQGILLWEVKEGESLGMTLCVGPVEIYLNKTLVKYFI